MKQKDLPMLNRAFLKGAGVKSLVLVALVVEISTVGAVSAFMFASLTGDGLIAYA